MSGLFSSEKLSSTYALRFCSRRFSLLSSSPGFPVHVLGVDEPLENVSLHRVDLESQKSLPLSIDDFLPWSNGE